jgi:hypothetical protein
MKKTDRAVLFFDNPDWEEAESGWPQAEKKRLAPNEPNSRRAERSQPRRTNPILDAPNEANGKVSN